MFWKGGWNLQKVVFLQDKDGVTIVIRWIMSIPRFKAALPMGRNTEPYNLCMEEDGEFCLYSDYEKVREALKQAAQCLQHNLSAESLKDENMMKDALLKCWEVTSREYCESKET
jgi:hypothetical protein